MLAISLVFGLSALLASARVFVDAKADNMPARRAQSPTIAIAADGQLLTLSEASPTTLAPPSAPQTPGAGQTKAAALLADDVSAPDPNITPAPEVADGENAINLKFIQTTYYTCVTVGSYSHCGWHEPIVDASGAPGARGGQDQAYWAVVAFGVASGLLLRL